jgi:hypothetical protein
MVDTLLLLLLVSVLMWQPQLMLMHQVLLPSQQQR